ncbi:MAG: hypothetical protein HWQ43_18545 [Nostoc sp. JL31]|uniref:hypothetical protein n=1 Tax=Nostoc sp. JL31 TaxID=2815395 RepID=UPI0025E32C8A|nr:hypothetical protein [Nostoc sp. JL31]MBN3891059.1 hypothetical protein [Nostoc sp. JL31]
MSIPNESESKNSEVKQESYTDINGNTHTDFTQTTETVKNNAANPNSYRNGYVQGQNTERSNQADLAQRDENNASGGLLLGIIITSLLGLVIGGVWYFNQQNNAAVNNAVPVVVPVPSKSSPTPSASPQPQTTIIERTREVAVPVPVPVPQQQVTPSSAPRQPDINITIPPQQPAAEKAPSVTQPAPPSAQSPATSPTTNTPASQNDSSTNTVAPATKSDTSKSTTPQGVDQSNSKSNSGSGQ